jgi:hypothetical protein
MILESNVIRKPVAGPGKEVSLRGGSLETVKSCGKVTHEHYYKLLKILIDN